MPAELGMLARPKATPGVPIALSGFGGFDGLGEGYAPDIGGGIGGAELRAVRGAVTRARTAS
jgi:hypothetical protein